MGSRKTNVMIVGKTGLRYERNKTTDVPGCPGEV